MKDVTQKFLPSSKLITTDLTPSLLQCDEDIHLIGFTSAYEGAFFEPCWLASVNLVIHGSVSFMMASIADRMNAGKCENNYRIAYVYEWPGPGSYDQMPQTTASVLEL